jgi:hypothetical protein
LAVDAHKLKVTIQEDHRTLATLAELRSVQLTPEEEEVLGAFETFRDEHPIRFTNLTEED